MIKKKLNQLSDWVDDRLRSLCGQISPDARIIIILAMLLLFGGGSIYMTISSIYNMGKQSGRQMQIEHIESLELEPKQHTDSINPINHFNYE